MCWIALGAVIKQTVNPLLLRSYQQRKGWWPSCFYLIFGLFLSIGTVSIPFVRNVYYQPTGTSTVNTIPRFNSTCNDCLCEYSLQASVISSTLALNCFDNDTCQFIPVFSPSYKLVPLVGATLYFQGKIFPNISTCCMPNITEVLARLQSSVPTMVNLTFNPGAIGYDVDSPNEAVTISVSTPVLYWFNPHNLQFIRNSSTWTRLSVVLYRGLLFTSVGGTPVINVRRQSKHHATRRTLPIQVWVTYPQTDLSKRWSNHDSYCSKRDGS